MILFTEAKPPELSPLIQIVIEQKIEQPIIEPPKTWRDNPNGCTDNQWIALESPFYCIEKPKPKQPSFSTQKPSQQPQNQSGNTYSYGYCTAYVKNKLSWVQNGWGDARFWISNARQAGFTVSSTPIVGSVATKGNHVAVVESISGDQITISEANYQGWNVVSSRTISSVGLTLGILTFGSLCRYMK